jgi:hypothetical protein
MNTESRRIAFISDYALPLVLLPFRQAPVSPDECKHIFGHYI